MDKYEVISKTINILLIEDDDDDVLLLRESLEDVKQNFRIKRAECLEEGISLLDGNFDVILLDLNLPDSYGMDTLERLLAYVKLCPVLVLTGNDDELMGIMAVQQGAQDYLVKSYVTGYSIARCIRYAIERQAMITELDNRKEELQKSEEEKAAILNNMSELVIYHDVNMRILWANKVVSELTNLTYEELIGKHCYQLWYKYSQPCKGCPVELAIKTGQPQEAEVAFKNDGILLARANPIKNAEGEVIGVVEVSLDITERKQAERNLKETNNRLEEALAELRKTQQQIIQQARMRALGELASGIAHDFNNALMPILGYTGLLLEVPDVVKDSEKLVKYLKTINNAAEDAKNIVSHLREFYRPRDEDEIFQAIHLNELVEEAIQLTKPKWKGQSQAVGIDISIKTELREIPPISGNKTELREVLTNLIMNSVDAMCAGGVITIRSKAVNGFVELKVSDTGVGMEEEVKQRCFDPFFSTKGKDGTGLGLSVVHGIIRRHEGEINIESKVGEGTSFIIRIPQAEQCEEKYVEEAINHIPSLHVLIVDDNPVALDILIEYLEIDGHTFRIATNGKEGLTKFHKDKFDVVITDRAMPDMDGIQFADFIKQSAPDTPVIMLTGFGDVMMALGEKPDSVDGVLSKPVKLDKFREILAYHTGSCAAPNT
jgi:PAS domain S-box-containing protein